MLAKIPNVFRPDQYLHTSNRFTVMRDWFHLAEVSHTPTIKEYVINAVPLRQAMPITEQDGFHTYLESPEIPYILFSEAQLFLNRALSNFGAQLVLHARGFLSWAIVTNYYSSHFSLSGLLRLQGKARISTSQEKGLPRGFYLSIAESDQPKCVIFPNWNNYHEQTCSDFYSAYRSFDQFRDTFGDLLSLRKEDLLEEPRRRNAFNYGIQTGYRELDSSDFEREDLRKISLNKLKQLPDLVSEPDPEIAFMARACSRLVLLSSASWHIAKDSPSLRPVFDRQLNIRKAFIRKTFGRSVIGQELLKFTRGRMRVS